MHLLSAEPPLHGVDVADLERRVQVRETRTLACACVLERGVCQMFANKH